MITGSLRLEKAVKIIKPNHQVTQTSPPPNHVPNHAHNDQLKWEKAEGMSWESRSCMVSRGWLGRCLLSECVGKGVTFSQRRTLLVQELGDLTCCDYA